MIVLLSVANERLDGDFVDEAVSGRGCSRSHLLETLACAISRQTLWVIFVNRLAKDCSVLLLRTLRL